jgi:neutral ceramidase
MLPGPTRWPVHVLTLGPHRLATVPGEPTLALGRRIRRALGGSVAVLGYAGEYAGYFTTPEEYDAQDYEGASVLWGRRSGEHVLDTIAGLAGEGAGRKASAQG